MREEQGISLPAIPPIAMPFLDFELPIKVSSSVPFGDSLEIDQDARWLCSWVEESPEEESNLDDNENTEADICEDLSAATTNLKVRSTSKFLRVYRTKLIGPYI